MNDEPIPPAAHAARPAHGASRAAPHDHARTAWALALFGLVPFVVMAEGTILEQGDHDANDSAQHEAQ